MTDVRPSTGSARRSKAHHAQHWHTRHYLRLTIVTSIERTYHRRRRQRRLGRLTPIEFESINRPACAA